MHQNAIILSLTLFCMTLPAAQYYVDSRKGDDSNPGTSQSKAWRSLEKVSQSTFKPDDEIRFVAGSRWTGQLVITAQGSQGHPVTFRQHGRGARPRIDAGGQFEDAVRMQNVQHVALRDFEITNTDAGASTNPPPRRGVHIIAEDAGTLTNVVVSDLFVHDIHGTQRIKHNGGIIFSTRGDRVPTRFDGLRIERNIVWRVDRSGIVAQSSHANRARWFPSTNVVIRDNWLGDVGGDGITPWATDGCIVEHNIVAGANERAGTYNAGIWPWSTDNTLMRLNRATGVKTMLDGQGFDSDYNSRNTLIEYNLSHDNEGGFLLVCTPGQRNERENCGNPGTVVRYNISRHDRARTFHFAGSPENTFVHDNAIYVAPSNDVQLVLLSEWSGWPQGLLISNNLFHAEGIARYGHQVSRDYTNGVYGIGAGWGPAKEPVFARNTYVGRHENRPNEVTGEVSSAPKVVDFKDWPGPQFDPRSPEAFPTFIKAHRAWMLRLMERQFRRHPAD